jgi:hypothetical protein
MEHRSALPKETPVMSTRSRNRSDLSAARPPLVGRLHEIVTTRPVPTPEPQVPWQPPHLAGQALIQSPQMTVLGQLGRGKTYGRPGSVAKAALARWLYVDAMRRTRRPVVVLDQSEPYPHAFVLDENAGGERLDLSAYADRVIDPLTFERALSTSPRVTTGEW